MTRMPVVTLTLPQRGYLCVQTYCPLLTTIWSKLPAGCRPQGYFPVPALKQMRGPFLELMRGILQSEACVRHGLYQCAYVDRLLTNQEARFTRIQGGKLWHLRRPERWPHVHVDGVPDRTITRPGLEELSSTSRA